MRKMRFASFQGAFNSLLRFNSVTYRPVFVIIISVPKSWNLSHNSFVSKWHCTGAKSSQLHESVKRDLVWNVYKIENGNIIWVLFLWNFSCYKVDAKNISKLYDLVRNVHLPKSVRVLNVLHPMHTMVKLTMFERFVLRAELFQSHCTVRHQHHHRFLHNDQLIMGLKYDGNIVWLQFLLTLCIQRRWKVY